MHRIRPAEKKDIPVIVDFRMKMFASFLGPDHDLTLAAEYENQRLADDLAGGDFVAWVVETAEGEIVASAGVSFYRLTPKPWNLDGRHAFISSMYTEPEHRRQGLGGKLLQAALDHVRERGLTNVTLHASNAGRSLYESFGFRQTNEMRLRLDQD